MISPSMAFAVLSIVKGLIKLTGRVDRLLAEKEAVTSKIVSLMPSVSSGPGGIRMLADLKKLLKDTKRQTPDPIDPYRVDMENMLVKDSPDMDQVWDWYKRFFKEQATVTVIDPDSEFIKELKSKFPSLDLEDEDIRLAAFYIGAGQDVRQIGYPWRIALIVVDVLAEFGAENTSIFVRDKKVSSAVQSVLERFSKPELESYDAWSPLLRLAISSTLNGVLDSRDAYQGENKWINAMLGAMIAARDKADEKYGTGDDYLLGLFEGKGYQLLVSEGLSEAAKTLNDKDASHFEGILSDVLLTAAPLWEANNKGFHDFFQEHWGDLLRAGLRAIEKQGPIMLKGESPLLRETLIAVVGELAKANNTELLSKDIVFVIGDAALGAVAAKPSLITGGIDEIWLKEFITSVTKTVSNQGIREIFSKESVEGIIISSLEIISKHPELIVKDSKLVEKLVGNVFEKLGEVGSFNAKALASAAIEGSLLAISANPNLLDTRYASVIADVTGELSRLITDKTITGIQASDIMKVVTESIIRNPILFVDLEDKLAGTVVEAVLKVAEDDNLKLLTGTTLVGVTRQLLGIVALHGKTMIADRSISELLNELIKVLKAGINRAEKELGKGLDIPSLPIVLSGLVAAWSRGDVTNIDPDSLNLYEYLPNS